MDEVLIADDASSDATRELLEHAPGLRYLRNPRNLGFLRSCNRAAGLARGRHLVFLNNDTMVFPDWLDALIDTLETLADAGVVGSKLIDGEGRLQEAGGIIWSDASGWNFGRGGDPDHPAYNYLRDVDYVSGASLAVRHVLWRELGGFDEHFAPAYYEDTDLAFRARAGGWRVLYQPRSVAVHYEGTTSGTSLAEGVKRHQALNLPKFHARWREVLSEHGSRDTGASAADRLARYRLLVVDSRTPMPDMDSGSIDTYEYLKILRRLGFRITFVPENMMHAGRYTEALQDIGVECISYPYATSFDDALRTAATGCDAAILYRAPVARKAFDIVKTAAPRATQIFDTVDLHFLRAEKEAELHGHAHAGPAAAQDKHDELELIGKCDMSIVLGWHELELVRSLVPGARCRRIPVVREVPGRADTPWSEREGVMFIGGYEHPPNIDAARYLVEQVWPLVREREPGLKLILAGSKMPDSVTRYQAEDIVIAGFVPELKSFMATLRLTVAPIRYGAGINGKVISSLCHGVPCVVTSVAIAGTELVANEDVLTANDPDEFAESICRLYFDRTLWERLSQRGVDSCNRFYSVEAVGHALENMMRDLGFTDLDEVGPV